jgi:hypothetical protein
MRTLTTAALAAISAGTVSPFYMVSIGFASGAAYYWTGVNTILWNTFDWTGQGDFLGVSSISQTSDLSAEGITIAISGLNADDVSSMIGEVAQNVPVDVWFGMLSAGAIIADPVHCFSGHIDVPTLQDDGNTATISCTAENALIVLARSSQRRYTLDNQQIDFPLDTGFQFVPTVQSWSGTWGGKGGSSVASGRFF